MNGNVARAQVILQALAMRGMRTVCICAGARNAPFVAALEKVEGLEVRSFFEERSAAFFALGRARRDRSPVAVIVTSGTAVAELLPAAVEAHYSGVPLALISADRPRRLRGTGAPQTIEQVGIFGPYAHFALDLEGDEAFSLDAWRGRGPLHLNVCFDEPLIESRPSAWSVAPATPRALVRSQDGAAFDAAELKAVEAAVQKMNRPLLLVSGLETEDERRTVRALALRLRAPIYAESTSGLREDPELAGLLLKSGDRILPWALSRGLFDGVLRVGGVPTARVWRDLEAPKRTVNVASIGSLPFAGLSTCTHAWGALDALANSLATEPRPNSSFGGAEELREQDAMASLELKRALTEHPTSEAALVRALSASLSDAASTYLGNSLPIREWDLAASRDRVRWTSASRGANGIDGQISTFLGGVRAGEEAWALIGDLTALYDLAAPWALPYLPQAKARVAVINNGGGMIFSRIFGDPLFENRHSLRFDAFAKAWGLDYERWSEVPRAGAESTGAALIEILPDARESDAFWTRYDALWTPA